jgi:hypothetical protein
VEASVPRPAVRPTLVLALALAALAALTATPAPAPAAPKARAYTYSISHGGPVRSDMKRFAKIAAATLWDARSWSMNARIRFYPVPSRGDLRLVLATPAAVVAAGPPCSAYWSCRVGERVLINEDRWRRATPTYASRRLRAYRHYVIIHEVGHWLGLGHVGCPGAGLPAPVMLQQSKGLGGCRTNVWPLGSELSAVAAIHRVPPPGKPAGFDWPKRIPKWFWRWAEWYLGRGEFRDKPLRSPRWRPLQAPEAIPRWAWLRLEGLTG